MHRQEIKDSQEIGYPVADLQERYGIGPLQVFFLLKVLKIKPSNSSLNHGQLAILDRFHGLIANV